jgi:hypothetical protein
MQTRGDIVITESEIEQFEQVGAVTIDTPFSKEQLDRVSAVFDRLLPFEGPEDGNSARYRVSQRYFLDPELLDLIQDPFLEAIAKKTLKAEAAHFFASTIIASYPQPDAEFSFSEHVDVKYSLSDLDAMPKRMLCSCLIWLRDVTEKRAPLMYRPGSHRLIAEDVEKNGTYIQDPVQLRALPDLPFADPVPLIAKAGQMTVCTTAMVHGPSVNIDVLPRKVMFIVFGPAGHHIQANMNAVKVRKQYYRNLRNHLRADRLGILEYST